MTDIVRLIQLDHGILRRQFADLYQPRGGGRPGELEDTWRRLVALLVDHDDATRWLVEGAPVEIDQGRRRALADSSTTMRHAIQEALDEKVGTSAWWEAVSAVHRSYRTHIVGSDDALIELLRAALTDVIRHELGQLWLERPPRSPHEITVS